MFRILIRLRMKQMISALFQTEKKQNGISAGKKILFGILFAYIGVVFGALFWMLTYKMTETFVDMGLGWLVFSLIGTLVFFLCFLGSVFVTQNQIFEARDNDMLFSMPIPPAHILGTRLLSVVIPNYVYELFVFVPSSVAYFVADGFDIIKLIFIIIVAIFLPLLAVVLSVLFAWIAASIASKSKLSNIISTVIKLALFGLYMVVMMRLQSHLAILLAKGEEIAAVFEKYVMPFYYMGKSIADGDLLKLAVFVLMCIIPAVFATLIISKNYLKIATMKKGSVAKKYTHRELKVTSTSRALFKKDFRALTSNSMVMFNSALGQLLILVVTIYALIKRDELNMFMMLLDESVAAAAVCAVFMMAISTVIISSSGISLEAKTLWLMKSMPVSALDICMSKVKVHVYTTIPFIVISSLIMLFIFDFTVIGSIMVFALPIAFTFFTGICGIMINLKFPKFNWLTEAAAVKQGLAPFLAMLVAMASAGAPILAVYIIMDKIEINIDMVLLTLFVLYTAISILLYLIMRKWCPKVFRTLD